MGHPSHGENTAWPTRAPVGLAGWLAFVLGALGCADSQVAPGAECATDEMCGATGSCVDGACIAVDMAPPDATPVDIGPDARPAPDARLPAIGDACDDADDCVTGPCIEAAGDGRRVCTGPCSAADPDSCPDGFVCAAVSNAGPDRTFLCFPEADILCRPCEDDSDCGGLSDRCLDLQDGRFCGQACDLRVCPEGYGCVDAPDQTPNCAPLSGVCSGCFDPDGDGYGVGVDCLGLDCAPEDGAVSPGAPEQCNAIDDDCDGAADEDFDLLGDPERCGACDIACRFEGAVAGCVDGGCVLDACLPERYDLDRRLDNGCEYFCEGDPAAAETCDGVDEDCDGAIDEGRPGADVLCETGDPGRCSAGSTVCDDGAIDCVRRFDPLPETCDGVDEDCDGAVDEGLAELGGDCDTGQAGRCATGARTCVDGAVVCEPRPGPRAEICDDVDDDCDGAVDQGCPGGLGTGADRNLTAFGGGGGGGFALACGAGMAAVGVDVRSAAEVDQVTVICQRVGLAVDRGASPHGFSTVAQGGQGRTGSAGGGGGGQSTLVCPDGSFLHALQVRSGARVDQASFTCARLDLVGYPAQPRFSRSDTGSRTFGGNGGGLQALQRCRDDELMAGLHGRSGGRVDRLGPICRTIRVQTR